MHNYDENAACIDTDGDFDFNCDTGFEGGRVVCTDVNECALGTDDCDEAVSNYLNTPGKYACTCKTGFFRKNGVCIDIDECANYKRNNYNRYAAYLMQHSICSISYPICSNALGGFECDGVQCTDINECDDESTCSEDAICTNSKVKDSLATTSMSAKLLMVITHYVQIFQALLNVHVMSDIRVMDLHIPTSMNVLLVITTVTMKTKSHAIVLLGSLVMVQQNVKITCYCNNGYSGDGDSLYIWMYFSLLSTTDKNVLLRT